MNNIPTAEEFIEQREKKDNYIYPTSNHMIEFTKLHVQAALKSASENAVTVTTDSMTNEEYRNGVPSGFDVYEAVDKESILNAYPLDNIK